MRTLRAILALVLWGLCVGWVVGAVVAGAGAGGWHRAGVMATDYLQGYKTIPDSGTPVPSTCGTEESQEGTAGGGNKWAKRKFSPGPIIDYDETKDSLKK